MANTFAITTTSDTLKLEPGAPAESVFTVTNSTSRPVRGLARVKAVGETKQEWLTIKGEGERDFAANGTEQYAVTFAPATNTAPGQYSFRLVVVASMNPDEDFTEGPVVTAEVTPPPPPPPPKSWLIPAALVAVLLVAVVVSLFIWLRSKGKDTPPATPSEVVVQTVIGLTPEAAKQTLEKQGLTAQVLPSPVAFEAHNVGEVVIQNPEPGKTVPSGGVVELSLKGPTMRVPTGIVGKKLADAVAIIFENGLKVGEMRGSDAAGDVRQIVPSEGEPILKGGTVVIYMPGNRTLVCKNCIEAVNTLPMKTIKP